MQHHGSSEHSVALGSEIAGVVVAFGERVTGWAAGDQVCFVAFVCLFC